MKIDQPFLASLQCISSQRAHSRYFARRLASSPGNLCYPMKKWPRRLHSIIVVSLVLALWLGLAVMYFGLMIQTFEDQVSSNRDLWMTIIAMAGLLTLGAGIVGIARKVRWPWLTGGIATVCALYGFLAHDAPPPPPIDLGVRVGNDDPTYQTIMWFSDKAPSSRLKEANPENWADKDLFLPEKTEEWAEHIQKHEAKILAAWKNDALGHDWINQLNSAVPGGVWRNSYEGPILNFKAIRSTYHVHLANALLTAKSGQGDEALRQVNQYLSTVHNLERVSPGLINQMIATVLKKKCYQVAEAILDLGNCSPDAIQTFRATLASGPAPQETFKLAYEGEKEWMRDVVDEGLWRQTKFQADMKQAKWFEVVFAHGAKWLVLNPNETNRQITRIMDDVHRLSDLRDEAAMKNQKLIWNTASSLKNPVGRLTTNMIIPAFQKVSTSIWEHEDRRQALLKKLTEAK